MRCALACLQAIRQQTKDESLDAVFVNFAESDNTYMLSTILKLKTKQSRPIAYFNITSATAIASL